jgi:hypothetical protein
MLHTRISYWLGIELPISNAGMIRYLSRNRDMRQAR